MWGDHFVGRIVKVNRVNYAVQDAYGISHSFPREAVLFIRVMPEGFFQELPFPLQRKQKMSHFQNGERVKINKPTLLSDDLLYRNKDFDPFFEGKEAIIADVSIHDYVFSNICVAVEGIGGLWVHYSFINKL